MVVFAGCLTEQGILELKSTAAKLPGILHTIKVDVTADDSVNEAKATVTKLLNKNGLDGIVNNAGVAACAYDDWITVKDYKNILEVNLFGVIRVTHAFKDLVKKNRGRIVNVSSVLSMVSLGSLAQYAVSKFGVKAFSDAIRTEYKQFGVTVSTLEPGFFRTQLAAPEPNAKRLQRVWDNLPQDIKDEYGEGYYQKVSRTAYEFLDSVGSTDTYKVVDAYFHALTSKYPKAKYHVGHDYYLFFFLSLLPAVVRDYIIYFDESQNDENDPSDKQLYTEEELHDYYDEATDTVLPNNKSKTINLKKEMKDKEKEVANDKGKHTKNDSTKGKAGQTKDYLNQLKKGLKQKELKYYSEFEKFVETYKKHYQSLQEVQKKFKVFAKNVQQIKIDQKNHPEVEYEVNEYTDLTEDEFEHLYHNNTKTPTEVTNVWNGIQGIQNQLKLDMDKVPDEWDWRKHNGVSPVRDQGPCGSCWAFTAVAMVESYYLIKKNKTLNLSVEQVLDCTYGNKTYFGWGCKGGNLVGAMAYIRDNGLTTEKELPYTLTRYAKSIPECKKKKVVATIKSRRCLHNVPEDQLTGLVFHNGPVGVSIDARHLKHLSKDYINNPTAPEGGWKTNHRVLLVGYGIQRDTRTPYWIVKNTWGTNWGDAGFFYLLRGNNSMDVASEVVYIEK
ncbi:unnamed protein product [Bursaphelenchus okinawaensis]|uniref:Uncharacterized protein n=1 Tax=Bursaphelenchus okinawaensis TaxID=465554 RepID=A0A811LS32_9BILA|nr:unnamed protein product [Bursaphelenchus okinawaensis]CAG9128596.1 unnamed protein product [Bursaphelenchus okinawaensis]